MPFPQFVVVTGPDQGRQFPIQPGECKLGRSLEAAYHLNDPRVSRFHCTVKSQSGVVSVTDNGGSGGVFVNGSKIETHPLKHGETVQVGDTLLRYLTGPYEEASTMGGVAKQVEYDPKATEQLAELSGRTLVRYAIGAVLGKGNTSMVFRAKDTTTGDQVALKIMQPAYAANQDDSQRFVRAMQAMLPLNHPNLVKVLAAGRSGAYCWAAMELVEGESLTTVIERIGIAGMLDWKYAFRVAVQIARALAYAHGQGIIHRDVAPANILIRSQDKSAMLGDLMLAKALEGALARQITRPGELVGDINYMSPERISGQGEGVDQRADLYGLGATCYTLLAGKPPFLGANMTDTIRRIRTAEPMRLAGCQMGIPESFEGAILKLLAKQPESRYASAQDLLSDLERIGNSNGVKL